MKEEKYYCDVCKIEVSQKRLYDDFCTVSIQVDPSYYKSQYGELRKEYNLCWNCAEKIGIKKENFKRFRDDKQQEPLSIQDRLFDIFQEILEQIR